jgi:ribonuclease HI
MYTHIKLFSDGGSRGNPGPAAIAFIIQLDNGFIQSTYSKFIGFHTNNQAEYKALIAGLKFVSEKYNEITCYLDSELVVKQVNGDYSVRNDKLRILWDQVQNLRKCFKKTQFISVPRINPYIQRADYLLNEKLDENI